MANQTIENILKKLSKFYGIRQYVDLSSSNKSIDNLQFEDVSKFNETVETRDEFLNTLLSKSQSSPTFKAIIDELNLNLDSKRPILITPYDENIGLNNKNILHLKEYDKGQGYIPEGSKHKGQPFALRNVVPDLKLDDLKKISVFQIFSPRDSINSTDTEVVSLFLNSMPTIELSRAVPFIDIHVATAIQAEEGTVDSSNYTFLGRFYNNENNLNGSDKELFNSKWSNINIQSPDLGISQEGMEKAHKIIGGIESFTMPQTAINMDNAYKKGAIERREIIDPFQPLMSIERIKINVIPQPGLMSFKTATVDLVVHDRSRLNEVTSLIAPDSFGTTRVMLTYGYSHPDGNKLSRASMINSDSTLFGQFIDSMKVTETFHVVSPKFSFEETSVKISLSLAMICGKTFENIEINDVIVDGEKSREVLTQLRALNDMLTRRINENRRAGLAQIFRPSFLNNPNEISSHNHAKILEELSKLRKSLKDDVLIAQIDVLFGRRPEIVSVSRNGRTVNEPQVGNAVGDIMRSTAESVKNFIDKLKLTPDPFLPIEHKHNVNFEKNKELNSYISLGKILSSFISLAVANRFDESNEFQIFFHPFSANAGGMQDYNISQFYLEYSEFENILLANFSPFRKMTLGNFFRLLQTHFINDLGAASYSILSDAERRSYFRNSNTKWKRVTWASLESDQRDRLNKLREEKKQIEEEKRGESVSAEHFSTLEARLSEINDSIRDIRRSRAGRYDEEAYSKFLDENRADRLRRIYSGDTEDFFEPLTFRVPSLTLYIDSTPARETWRQDNNITGKSVVKIHIYDRTCSDLYTVPDILRSAPERIIIPPTRKTRATSEFLFASNHQKYASIPLDMLQKAGYIKKFNLTADDISRTAENATRGMNFEPESITQKIAETKEFLNKLNQSNVFIVDCLPEQVNKIIRSVYPTLTYGSLASGILKASVSSMNDSSLTTVMILRDGKGEIKGNPDREGVPISVMPTSLSLETIGCPFVSYTQYYFVDLGTNTNIDNVYAISGIEHSIEPGKFSTSLKMLWLDSYANFRPITEDMKTTAIRALILNLGLFRNK